ncbi:MAG: hypothetical protein WC864_01760 [Ilumatobacteraceae bacterium]
MSQHISPLILERISCPLSQWTGEHGRCQWCDEPLDQTRRRTWCSEKCGRAWQREHVWRFARSAAKRRAKYRCIRPECTAARRDCEVNHLLPRDGKGYAPGCHHHLLPDRNGVGGLEVLCHAHHAEVTAAQSSVRAELRRQAKILAVALT